MENKVITVVREVMCMTLRLFGSISKIKMVGSSWQKNVYIMDNYRNSRPNSRTDSFVCLCRMKKVGYNDWTTSCLVACHYQRVLLIKEEFYTSKKKALYILDRLH